MKHITLLDHIDPIKREFIALLDLMEYPRDSLRWEALFKFGAFLANINPPAMSTQLKKEPKNTHVLPVSTYVQKEPFSTTYKESFGRSLADRAQEAWVSPDSPLPHCPDCGSRTHLIHPAQPPIRP